MNRPPGSRPDWLKVRAPAGKRVEEVSEALARHGLRTVCREARCPNVGECWGAGTATVILLGDVCTRGCAFCSVTAGTPAPPDPSEPDRVANAAADLSWRHVVVTSVTRDDLPDGGAAHFAAVVRALRREAPGVTVELLVPDFAGDAEALRCVVDAAPDILAHNVETVPRLYPVVRKGAEYDRSLDSSPPRRHDASLPSAEIRDHGRIRGDRRGKWPRSSGTCSPRGAARSRWGNTCRLPGITFRLMEYVTPRQFELLAETARAIGFDRVLSGPLVRSSYYQSGI